MPTNSRTGEPGDALKEALQANAREIGVLALGTVGYPKRIAEQTYDQDPEARKVFLELASMQMRRTITALGQDWDTLSRAAGLVG